MNFPVKTKKYLIKFLKVIGWTLVSALGLLILLSLSIQIPYVQNKLVQKAIGFLQGKIGTEVRLAHISLSIPKKIILTGLYLEDQSADTLLYAGELSINTDLWALTKHTIQLNDVDLSDFTATVSRSERDSAFNFDYIIKAFAGDRQAIPDTTQEPWKFSIGDVSLQKIHFLFDDALLGNDMQLNVGSLDLGVEEFDLDKSIIKINNLEIENVKVNFTQSKIAPDTVVETSDTLRHKEVAFDFGVNEIRLKDIQGNYNHRHTGQVIRLNLGELSLDADEINLKSREIFIDKFELLNTFLSYQQMAGYKSGVTVPKDTLPSGISGPAWHIVLNELELSNNNLQYHNYDQPLKQASFDAHHLWITKLNTEAKNLEWRGDNVKGELTNLSLHDRSGFSINSFGATFSLTENSMSVEDFNFNSPNTKLALNAEAKFSSLATLSKTYPEATAKLIIRQSTIGWRDVQFFMPTLSDSLPFKIPPGTTVKLDTEIDGPLKSLSVRQFTLAVLSQTYLAVKGTVQLLKENPEMNLQLEKFYTTKDDVTSILADTLIPSSIALPTWINLTGFFKGTFNSPDVSSILTSSMGTAELNAKMKLDKSSGLTRYTGKMKLKEFNTGQLLKKEESMGPITLTASIDGSGLKMEELNTDVELQIFKFLYEGYEYKDFKLKGTVKKYFFSGTAQLQDENLNMKLDGDLDYNEKIPRYHFVFELKNADFKALHLSERPLRARGTLDIDLATSDFKVINGKLDIRKFAIYNGTSLYAVDSLLFASIDQQGQSEISIRSDIIDGNFEGTINLYSLAEVLRRHFNAYFSLHDTSYKKPVQPQNFKFDLKIKNTELITEILVPELDPFIPGRIAGEFDSHADRLDLSINLAKIRYSGIGADSITFAVTSNAKTLDYTLAVRKIQMDTLRIEALKLVGNVQHDSIRTKLTILDSLQKEKYVLGGVFHSMEKVFQFQFLKDEVILNSAPWTAPPDNALQFTSKGIQAHNFSITNINEKIALETTAEDSTVSIVFKDLNLQNITKLIEGTTPIDGLANGDLNIMASKKGVFNSTLRIDDLKILNQPWGDLSLALGKTSAGPLNIDLRIEGENTELQAGGYYTANPSAPEVNFTATISKLNLASIEPLTLGQLKNTKGQLTGEVKIVGNPTHPDIDGEIRFKNAAFTPSQINSEFSIKDERIKFTGEEIVLDDFAINDKNSNKATLDGNIKTSMFRDFDMNLNLIANNFQILNSTANDNELFYGKVSITTKAQITGNLNQPVVNMNIKLSDDSDFTYVVPQSEKGVLEQKGIVEFIDRDAKKDPFLAAINPRDTVKSTFKGVTLSANIELNDKETFNIIIDPLTGDKLSVKGNSTLTLEQDPTGDMILSGRYEITEGSYDLSFYKLVKRKFLIEKGSTIIWSGDPLDATMNIRAIYEVETSPSELLPPDYSNPQYKQRLPFLVYLQIKGEMLTPEISFRLDMPESKRNALEGRVYATILDINTRESELNKQVFALLVLKRFISDNPLDNRAGSDVASTARRSVSKLLSEQLNRLSENIKGVELSFDVKSYEDYSTGDAEGQTQVQLGLSKSLLDDRLIVKVSGNVDVEGETSNQNSVSDYIGDLALEYKLTEDGRFRITGFRNNNYDMIDGELIETGVGLIYIKDFNTLRELFKANAKDN